jgi:hypothetical protein
MDAASKRSFEADLPWLTPEARAAFKKIPELQGRHKSEPELKVKLDESASTNGRSVTAEIQSRLEHSFRNEDIQSAIGQSVEPATKQALKTLLPVLQTLAERVERLEARDRATQLALAAIIKIVGESDQSDLPAFVAAIDASMKAGRQINAPTEVVEYFQELRNHLVPPEAAASARVKERKSR